MKWFLVLILFLLAGISCREQLNQPTEQEIKNALTDWNYSKSQILTYVEGPFIRGLPSQIKSINVIVVNREKGSRKRFVAKVVVEGKDNNSVIPCKEFMDTIKLELKKIEKTWVIESMKHQYKFLGNYNLANTRF